jgi:tetratricopeptide (TPR) repeat protein
MPFERAALYTAAKVAAERLGDTQVQAMTLSNLGSAAFALGQIDRAIERYTEQLDLAQSIGDQPNVAYASWNLGLVYEDMGELERAIELQQVYVDFLFATSDADAQQRAATRRSTAAIA